MLLCFINSFNLYFNNVPQLIKIFIFDLIFKLQSNTKYVMENTDK